jgi:glycosyltransferase involved in cell wall biosynthesis
LTDHGVKIILVSQKLLEEHISDLLVPSRENTIIHFITALLRFGRMHSPAYKRQLLEILLKDQCNIIHSHGIWLQCNRHAAGCARILNIPHIISTRGMLEPWAIHHHAWRKKPIWYLWQKRALTQATAFCASSEQEAEHIRALGFRQPIAVIPNGVYFSSQEPKSLQPDRSGNIALFLSRIHPKKGLRELVEAWARVRPVGWKVIIAGPDENGHRADIEKIINTLRLDDVFEFTGPVDGLEKERLYRKADLFILPTFSENFGIVVAEALAAGTPVITTKGAPWSGLVAHDCGWWIDIGADPLAEAIRQATSLSGGERLAMGQRGHEYVTSEFGWDEIGHKMTSFYEWILNGGSPPDCVRLD